MNFNEYCADLDHCPRCSLRHEWLKSKPFANGYATLGGFTHWATCPETNEPVFVKLKAPAEWSLAA